MGDLVLKGATSGQITLTPTAIAGTNTLTLPAKTGNIITSADSGTVTQTMLATGVGATGPAFLAYQNSAQSISANTYTKLQMDTKETNGDSNSCYNTSTYRFTPNVAGYYQINGAWEFNGAPGANGQNAAIIYKNGSVYKWGYYGPNTSATAYIANVSSIVYCNGSSDYIEFYAYIGNANGVYTGSLYTYFNGCLVRAA